MKWLYWSLSDFTGAIIHLVCAYFCAEVASGVSWWIPAAMTFWAGVCLAFSSHDLKRWLEWRAAKGAASVPSEGPGWWF